MLPILSVIVPTIGRSTLDRMLASIRHGSLDEEYINADRIEILVIGDCHIGAEPIESNLEYAAAVSKQYDARYVEYDGGIHCFGHPQRNYGQSIAIGRWLAWLQDDDVWTPGAVDEILKSIDVSDDNVNNLVPRIFRTQTWQAGVVWKDQAIREANVDADCIVALNYPDRLGEWINRYCGDFDFIQQTCKLWDNQVKWEEFVIAVGRPK